jgi:hypothetical protein
MVHAASTISVIMLFVWWAYRMPDIQRLIFAGGDAILFRGYSDMPPMMFTVFFSGALALLTFCLAAYFLDAALLPGFFHYATGIPSEELPGTLRSVLYAALVLSPFALVSYNEFTRVSEDGITYRPFPSILGRDYQWSDVKSASLSLHIYKTCHRSSCSDWLTPQLTVRMEDGWAVPMWSAGERFQPGQPSEVELINLVRTIRRKGVPLTVADPYGGKAAGILARYDKAAAGKIYAVFDAATR